MLGCLYEHIRRMFCVMIPGLPLHQVVYVRTKFTFMLPCIVIDFLLNNQPDALIIKINSVIKLYMFRTSLPIIRSFILYIRHW